MNGVTVDQEGGPRGGLGDDEPESGPVGGEVPLGCFIGLLQLAGVTGEQSCLGT